MLENLWLRIKLKHYRIYYLNFSEIIDFFIIFINIIIN